MIWTISDTHFNHVNVIKYSKRPYKDVVEMNAKLIDNWNSVVKPEDTVYFLGDFSMGRHSEDKRLFSSLNGTIKMIMGNHDKNFNVYSDNGEKIGKVNVADVKKYWKEIGFDEVFTQPIVLDDYFILSHEPINGLFESQIFANIHGHTHTINLEGGNYFNVSAENINYTPISFEEVKERIVNG